MNDGGGSDGVLVGAGVLVAVGVSLGVGVFDGVGVRVGAKVSVGVSVGVEKGVGVRGTAATGMYTQRDAAQDCAASAMPMNTTMNAATTTQIQRCIGTLTIRFYPMMTTL